MSTETITYADKLKLPEWQKCRLKILERDKFMCQCCGDTKTELQIHHKAYLLVDNPWDYEGRFLITLCRHCHTIVTELNLNLFTITPIVSKVVTGPFIYIFFVEDKGLHIYTAEPVKCVQRFSHNTANKMTQALINFWNQMGM